MRVETSREDEGTCPRHRSSGGSGHKRRRGRLFCWFLGVALVGSVFGTPRSSRAITCTWKSSSGGSGGAFATALNWVQSGTGGSLVCPPGAGDTAVFSAGSEPCTLTGNVSVNALSTGSTYAGTISPGSYTVTTAGSLSMGAGTWAGGSGAINVGSSFNLSGGALTSTSNILAVAGDFNKTGGTFTHNSGTVLLSSTGSASFVSGSATFNNLVINDGLVGYWKMDDAAGPSLDSSGYGRDATWGSTPAASTTVPTLAFTDARSLSIDSAADTATFTCPTMTTVTVAAWIRATAAGGGNYQRILDAPGYVVFLNGAGLTAPDNPMSLALTSNRSSVVGEWKSPSNSVTYGAWYHVAITYDSSSVLNTPALYINGVSQTVTTKTVPIGTQTSSAGTAYIGNTAAGTRFFNGLIDDLRLYNRVLSAAEISALALGNQPGTAVGTQTLSGNPTVAGDLVIASGTLAAGASALTVGGSWWNYGGLFTAQSAGLVTFNGAGSNNTIRSAGQLFGAVTINGTGTWTLGDRLELNPASTLTTTAGTLSLSSYTLRAGNLDNNGVALTPASGKVVLGGNTSFTTDQGAFTDLRIEPVAATELVGYWKMDERQGPQARDYAPGGNDLTLANGTTWAASGATGVGFENPGALTFEGAILQYAGLGSMPAVLQPATLTLSAWYKATSVDVSGSEVVNGGDHYAIRIINNTTIYAFKQVGALGWSGPTATVANALDGNWHHVALTVSATTVTVYFDGVSVGTTSDSNAIYYSGVLGFRIGRNPAGVVNDFTGSIDEVRVYNTALSAAQIAALAAGRYPAGLTGVPTYNLGANTTVSGSFGLDGGTFATGANTFNASAAGNAAAVNSGTFAVGTGTSTFAGGLAVRASGRLDLSSSGGTVAIGSAKTLTMDGTLSASSTGATIQSAGGGGTHYAFTVGSTATATPTLNITGLAVKNTDTNGLYVNAVAGAATTFTRFDNIAFSAGTGTRLLQIQAPTLHLISNGCSFDGGAANGSTTYNVTLRGDGSATETRALFGNATCATDRSPCESHDQDDDLAEDGIGDTIASDGAVAQWVRGAQADPSGTIESFPTAAFDWNTFTYYSTYVTFHDVAGGTADRIYVRDSAGNPKSATSYWETPAGVDLVGAARYDTIAGVHYVYVATTAGKVYRLIDNTTSNTLAEDASGNWSSGAYDCSCTITTPLTVDTNNIYWGGTASGNKIWTLGKSSRALASSSPVTVSAVISGAAPTVWIDSNSHVQIFMGSAAHFYKMDINAQTLITDNAAPSGNVNGRVSIINSKVYGADDRGTLWVLSPENFSTLLWSYHDDTNHNGCASGSVCAVTSSLYVDPVLNRAFYGDGDGHLYASSNLSGTTGTQATGFPFRPGSASDVFAMAPLYHAGMLVAGTTTGTVYIIDVNGGSGPVVRQTYQLGAATRVSGVGYARDTASYMVAAADPTNQDGKLVYIDAVTDPTPASN